MKMLMEGIFQPSTKLLDVQFRMKYNLYVPTSNAFYMGRLSSYLPATENRPFHTDLIFALLSPSMNPKLGEIWSHAKFPLA